MNRTSHYLSLVLCLLIASSCSTVGEGNFDPKKGDQFDADKGLNRSDYTKLFDKNYGMDKSAQGDNPSEPPIPGLADILAAPEPPKLAETKLVSVAVTEDVPLKDVLIEVARLADVDIEVDAGISGGVSFRAKDRPFNEVVERICDLAGLRYSTKSGVLRVERDTPYIQIYSLDLLNIDRTSSGNVDVSSSGNTSSGGGGSGGGFSGGSKSTITAKADSDFWKQFEESIKQILAYQESSRTSGAFISSQTPAAAPTTKPASPATSPATPSRPAAVAAASTASAPKPEAAADSFYVLNKQASTLTVSATEKQHRILKRFLDKIETNASAQVLIEAKIVEVTLNDEYQGGINWQRASGGWLPEIDANFSAANSIGGPFSFTIRNKNLDLSSAVALTEKFGTTRTLSSPRLHATNNQQAVLTFADNIVYFDLKFDITDPVFNSTGTITTPGKTKVTSTVHNVPVGILLTLQPSINTQSNEVTLSVRPTLSRILRYVEDPSVAINTAANPVDIKSLIPEVQVRELDSILKVKSGQVMIIGGLMETSSGNTDTGVPGVSSVPYLGNLFKSTEKSNKSKELVIFIKATIVGTNGSAKEADKQFYEKYVKDPRPLFDSNTPSGEAPKAEPASAPPAPPATETPAAPINIPPLPAKPSPETSHNGSQDFPPSALPDIPPLVPLTNQ